MDFNGFLTISGPAYLVPFQRSNFSSGDRQKVRRISKEMNSFMPLVATYTFLILLGLIVNFVHVAILIHTQKNRKQGKKVVLIVLLGGGYIFNLKKA
jgi:hypothetical protein